MTFIALFSLFLFVVIGDARISLHDNRILDAQLSKCTKGVVQQYFSQDVPITIVDNAAIFCNSPQKNILSNYNELIAMLYQEIDLPLIHLGCVVNFTLKNSLKSGSAILLLPDEIMEYTDLMTLCEIYVLRLVDWLENRAVRIILVSKVTTKTKKMQMLTAYGLLQGAWGSRVQIADSIVLLPEFGLSTWSKKKTPAIDAFTWFPSDQSDVCLRELDRVKFLDRWVSERTGFLRKADLYPVKAVSDMRGCTLKVDLILDPPLGAVFLKNKGTYFIGTYGMMLQTSAEFLNIHLSYTVRQSRRYTADIVAPIFLTHKFFSTECIVSYPYFMDTVTWYVPVFQIPKWQGPIRVFSMSMWINVTVAYVLGSFTFWLLGKHDQQSYRDVSTIFLNTLKTYIGVGVRVKYRGVGVLFLIVWLLYCMQIYTAYQSILTGFLVNPGDFPQIQTLQGSELQNFTTIGFDSDNIDEQIWNKYTDCTQQQCWTKLTEKQKVAVFGLKFFFDLFINMEYNNKKPGVYRITESVKDYLKVAYMDLGCIFGRSFNSVFSRLVTSGFPDKWIRDLTHNFWMDLEHNGNDHPDAISLVHIQGILYFLLIGFLLGLILFITEIIIYKIKIKT
ncbi:Ionotropic receptor 548 [Blattella germanica]|nr:Ionotropic receptor 548 [Blattella germanica]